MNLLESKTFLLRPSSISLKYSIRYLKTIKLHLKTYSIWTKLVCSLIASLIIGFGIGESQSSYVVVNSTLRQKYQAEPGKQEWITVIECISADGSSIPPIVIFKGENLMTSWMPQPAPKGWYFSCNTKGWTSNEHGENSSAMDTTATFLQNLFTIASTMTFLSSFLSHISHTSCSH